MDCRTVADLLLRCRSQHSAVHLLVISIENFLQKYIAQKINSGIILAGGVMRCYSNLT